MKGTYQYGDGSQYKGEWSEEGQREGYGIMKFTDGSQYYGMFKAGLCEGPGVMVFSDNSRYEGEFQHGKFHGRGVFMRCDGMKFEGEFQNGKISGLGLVTFSDGSHGLPRNEGYFNGNQMIRREKCPELIHTALRSAETARNLKA
ncbi:MORN repeat-containing protein 4-like isoform X2 [Mercenaria mercenaria]|nr:MORN repeat-containing protein 4-like isoform X2 [Mercenaria mercenaria]XP_045189672.1 MORN repeat-containing protein 4-like isoform X2 [Mercenaria mercenaria]